MSRLCDGCMGQCILRAGMEGTRLYTYKPTCTLQMNFDVRSHVTGVIFASELFHVRHVALIIQVSYKGQTHLYYGYASCYLRQRSCGVNAIPVCLSVCLSVTRISQKDGFEPNFGVYSNKPCKQENYENLYSP